MKRTTKLKPITSAKQARMEQGKLTSYWSEESRLTQRTLIYIAELLEELVKKRNGGRKALTPWQEHSAAVLKSGGTLQKAALLWKSPAEPPADDPDAASVKARWSG